MEYKKQWEFLKGKFEAGQLGHAYIFSGQDMEGLKAFTKDFVQSISCKFPDVMTISSSNSKSSLRDNEDKQEIDISLIREAQHFLSYKSYYGGYKTVIIEHAERMNLEAQNCFLKNLEEPKGDTVIMLLSSKPEMLLPTITSRCQRIKFLGGASPQAQLPQNVSNILNLDLAEKFKFAKAANLDGVNFQNMLQGLQQHFRNLLLAKLGIGKAPENNYSLEKLKKIIRLIETISHNSLIYNSSPKLALEIILLEL